MKNFKLFPLLSIFVLAGCATTPYQKAGFFSSTGGYEDKIISEGVYYIKSKVNAKTEPKMALVYWHKRAKELCGHSEYKAEVKTKADTNVNPDPYSTTSQWPVAVGNVYCNKNS